MRFSATSLLSTLFVIAATATSVQSQKAASRPPRPPRVCNPNARGPQLERQQQEATAGFADLFLVQQDVQLAFDTYVPGQYIQHNPFAPQGREFAIEFLSTSMAQGIEASHITAFAGQGYGILHYKMRQLPPRNATFAVVDYFRFEGTCIVEHWDVLQVVTGNEPNPIAFF